jgi:membrane protein DedA with SNARE-associated domain
VEDLGLAAVVGLLLIKEAGVPVPVPGDLLILGAGAAAAAGSVEPISTFVLIVAATIGGGLIQFGILRGRLRTRLLEVLRRVGLPESRIEGLAGPLRARGATGVALARMTPGVRIVAIPAAVFAAVPPGVFAAGLATGNTVFVTGHYALGAVLGPPAVALAGSIGPALVAIVGGLALIGLIGWLAIRRRGGTARRPGGVREISGLAGAAGDWVDAACPACLALGAGRALLDRGRSRAT